MRQLLGKAIFSLLDTEFFQCVEKVRAVCRVEMFIYFSLFDNVELPVKILKGFCIPDSKQNLIKQLDPLFGIL